MGEGTAPRRGRPRVDTTLDLDGLVARWAERHAMGEAAIDWADPEPHTSE